MKRAFVLPLVLVAVLTVAAQKSAEHVKTYTPDAIQWGAAPDALPPGAQLAVLEGNPMKPGPYTMRLKMPDGYKIPPHHHLRREHVTVVSGTFKVGMGDQFDEGKMNEFAPGSFAYLEPTVHHYASAKGESVIQLHGSGPWEIRYVNPEDDPRKSTASEKKKEKKY
jgi:quercetin dioxygenase-like cupin family protein